MFLDIEGSPAQELAAIEVNCDTYEIMDVYHGFAFTEEEDSFARQHIHGLNRSYLKEKGLPNEACLISMFKAWLNRKPCVNIYCNDNQKESKVLNLKTHNYQLLPWAERCDTPSHRIAIRFKELCIPILGQKCVASAHCDFISACYSRNTKASAAKTRHGYHCALYDVLELYYEILML